MEVLQKMTVFALFLKMKISFNFLGQKSLLVRIVLSEIGLCMIEKTEQEN